MRLPILIALGRCASSEQYISYCPRSRALTLTYYTYDQITKILLVVEKNAIIFKKVKSPQVGVYYNFVTVPGVPKKTIHCLISCNVKSRKAISIK